MTKAPPWIQTITGSFAPAAARGAQTLRVRQSSEVGPGSPAWSSETERSCGHALPNSTARRTPAQGAAGSGACQRKSPIGAAAYGMPRKIAIVSLATPSTAPAAVVTRGTLTVSP